MSIIEDKKQIGVIFNIQKYSVHDGPGIRTIVFLKGCPLHCAWCSNPESQVFVPELAYNAGKCIGVEKCKHCINICPNGAIALADDGKIRIDRTLCKNCVEICVPKCPPQALIAYGHSAVVKDVIDEVEQDSMFYTRSGGGLTLSGGEPLAQKDFALALLREAKKRRIKTSIETCGFVPKETMLEAAQFLNSMMFDIKHIDSDKHRAVTGQGNERILENFKAVVEAFPNLPIVVRTPIIPNFNDSESCVLQIAAFIKSLRDEAQKHGKGDIRYELLPYHRLGTQKYTFLGKEAPMGDVTLASEPFNNLVRLAKEILG